jgi:hypothetical protein
LGHHFLMCRFAFSPGFQRGWGGGVVGSEQ